jgi:hypothetical protein
MTEAKSVDALLAERATTHGEYADHAQLTQDLLAVMQAAPSWAGLPAIIKETLHMHAHKIGRILTGNPFLRDHHDDIAGYARLISQRINADQTGLADEYVRPRPAPRDVPEEPQPAAERPGLVLTPDDVGKVFRTRDGRRIKLDNAHHSVSYPYHGVTIEDNCGVSFTDRGSVYQKSENPLDLVERLQYSEPLVITKADVGKKFQRRDGGIATVIRDDKHPTYPFDVEAPQEPCGYSVTRSGAESEGQERYSDLVARVDARLTLTSADVGRRFMTRDGQIATIKRENPHNLAYPFAMQLPGRIDMSITRDGSYWSSDDTNDLDLVARVD